MGDIKGLVRQAILPFSKAEIAAIKRELDQKELEFKARDLRKES